ncbi:MAG: hypothetical protein B9S33_17960 [Pedosphaera sp. Tous-C6FEB]|nr:MAG: hypothetical protein B9S33_17960 [Pedosphaera sp. Tous-C6FEB]
MPNEPQRDIEKDLLAYKLRRHEQAGAPQELHPATRRMLQSEVARSVGRPLLSSEEAAKNFVRSFAMSHQQPGFFTRHRPRLIWGGAMFAGLILVLAVVRNDPRQQEQARTFSDALPPPPAAPAAPAPMDVAAARGARATGDRQQSVADRENTSGESLEQLSRRTVSVRREAAPAAPARPLAVASVEKERLGVEANNRLTELSTAPAKAKSGAASASQSAQNLSRDDSDAERKFSFRANDPTAAARTAGAAAPLRKAAEPQAASSLTGMTLVLADKNVSELSSGQLGDVRSRTPAPVSNLQGSVAAPAEATATSFVAASSAPMPMVQKRFQQLDDRSGYRQNFNSPPIPPVLQDFAFERIGDRVRIVDGDGSTYEGTVLPEAVEEAQKKAQAEDGRELKERAKAPVSGGTQVEAYRFVARGLNRKLNQSVEFRGQWQPAGPPATDVPALRAAHADAAQPELRSVMLKEKAAGGAIAAPAGPATKGPAAESPAGRISGRAVVGGASEFELRAVPR